MSEPQNVTENVTLALQWSAGLFPVMWAYRPQEVPMWDSSRGFPLQRPVLGIKVLYTATREEVTDYRVLPDDFVLNALREEIEQPSWEPGPPPRTGYPRLVRADFKLRWREWYREGMDIVNPVAALERLYTPHEKPGKQLLKEVKKLAETFGAPDQPEDQTLWEWVILGLEASAHLEAIGVTKDVGFDELREHSRIKHEQWLKDFGYAGPFPDRPYGGPWLLLSDRAEKADSLKEFRNSMLDLLFGPTVPFRVRTKSKVWLRFQLAKAWHGEGQLKICEGCGRRFLQTRTNRLTCSARCRKRKKDRLAKQ